MRPRAAGGAAGLALLGLCAAAALAVAAVVARQRAPPADAATAARRRGVGDGGAPLPLLLDPRFPTAWGGAWTPAQEAITPCVLVRFHAPQRNALAGLLHSLFMSGHPRLRAIVFDSGGAPLEELPALVAAINEASGREWVAASPRTQASARAAFPAYADPDYGYFLSDLVMEDVLADAASASPQWGCDAIVLTNGDNLYSTHFLPQTLAELAAGADMVGVHWVTHHHMAHPHNHGYQDMMTRGIRCGHMRNGSDAEVAIHEAFLVGCVDLGAVIFRVAAVARTGLRFGVDRLRADPTGGSLVGVTVAHALGPKVGCGDHNYFYCADGHFFSRLAAAPGVVARVIRRVMLYHQ